MTILDLRYHLGTGPARVHYSPGNPGFVGSLTVFRDLEIGVSSESLANEAAAELAISLNAAYGVDFEPAEENPPREPDPARPPPPPVDPILQIYLDRAGPYAAPVDRVIARWSAFNHVQLAAGRAGWSQEAIQSLLRAQRCQDVVDALTTYGWGLAASTLAAATTEDHPLATPDVVEAYLAAMAAEGALPQ